VLAELDDPVLRELVGSLDEAEVSRALDSMPPEEVADVVEELPKERAEGLLDLMAEEKAEEVQELLEYREGTAGRLMSPDFVAVNEQATVAKAIEHIRRAKTGEGAFYLWVHVPGDETSESYAARLAERNILVVPGPSFGPSGQEFIRLAMVPTVEDCKRAVEVWPA